MKIKDEIDSYIIEELLICTEKQKQEVQLY